MSMPQQALTRLERLYCKYLQHENSADFVAGVSQHYSNETLKRLASGGSRVVRRAAVLALGFLGNYDANEVVGRALRDRDRAVRLLAEHGLRQIWFRAGNPAQYRVLLALVRLNDNGHYHEAIDLARELLCEAPLLAEAWNQRAIADFSLFDYEESALNCQRAIDINPYHYNAAMGQGHCYLQMDQPILALEAFRDALRINPNLECVRSQIRQLERSIDHERLDD